MVVNNRKIVKRRLKTRKLEINKVSFVAYTPENQKIDDTGGLQSDPAATVLLPGVSSLIYNIKKHTQTETVPKLQPLHMWSPGKNNLHSINKYVI